jgi:hypothetical protein
MEIEFSFYRIARNWSRLRIGGGSGSGLRPWRGRLGRLVPDDIDTALKVSAVFDDDAGGLDVSDEFGVLADIDFVQCLDVSINSPEHDDFARFDSGANPSIGPNGQAMFV